MTQPVFARANDPSRRVDAVTFAPTATKGGWGRDLRLVLTTIGFTSLAWLIIGGLLMGWLWKDRPDEEPLVTDADRALTDADRALANGGADRAARQGYASALPVRAPGASLVIPVAGVKPAMLTDTFNAARAGGARSHDAIDIMAAAGTPVMAAASGSVEKLFDSEEGGRTIYIRSGDGNWIYYYAHLQGYVPGLAEGQAIRAGEPIGRVGSTGNADPAAPHLHLAVMQMAPGEEWYEGSAVNPFPLLAGQRREGR